MPAALCTTPARGHPTFSYRAAWAVICYFAVYYILAYAYALAFFGIVLFAAHNTEEDLQNIISKYNATSRGANFAVSFFIYDVIKVVRLSIGRRERNLAAVVHRLHEIIQNTYLLEQQPPALKDALRLLMIKIIEKEAECVTFTPITPPEDPALGTHPAITTVHDAVLLVKSFVTRGSEKEALVAAIFAQLHAIQEEYPMETRFGARWTWTNAVGVLDKVVRLIVYVYIASLAFDMIEIAQPTSSIGNTFVASAWYALVVVILLCYLIVNAWYELFYHGSVCNFVSAIACIPCAPDEEVTHHAPPADTLSVWKQQARINYIAAQMAINIEHAISMKYPREWRTKNE